MTNPNEKKAADDFLPMSKKAMKRRGWSQCDFVFVIGDAYVDHSSFGPAIISRHLEANGYKVGIISQPDWKDDASITKLGEPRLAFLVCAGNMDSMVNHYTVAKKRRKTDAYTPGGVMGKRPDYATVVYSNLIRRTYKYTPIIFETALAGEELSAYRDVKCYSFLVKPFGEEEFVTAFRDALGLSKQMSQQAKTIQIEQKQFILEYVTQDIAYIEAFGKKLVIHTSSRLSGIKEDTISGYTLSGLLALLDDPAFVQCHKSYAVNKSHIEKIDKSGRKICLKGFTDTIPVGNKYQAELWG